MRSEQLEIELLGEQIAMHAAHLDAATHRLLTDLRAFDQAGGWYRAGAMSCANWLSWRVGWDGRTAREHVRVANRLGELPLIDDALRRGEMSYSKIRAMTRVATPANEACLLEQARYATGAQLEKICRLYASVERHDADTTPSDDRQRRHVTRRQLDDGMVRITATLHPEEAALVWTALERVAKERCRASGSAEPAPTDPATESSLPPARPGSRRETRNVSTSLGPPEGGSAEPAARDLASSSVGVDRQAIAISARVSRFDRADAMVAMAQEIVRGAAVQRSPIDLIVTVQAETLRARGDGGMDRSSETASDVAIDVGVLGDGECISTPATRRLACDCGITEVVEDASGTPLSIGRKRRTIPGAMKRALLRRDRTCRFPGCNTRVFLEGHHVQHWADGGQTALANLASLCSWHHRHVHEHGFQIAIGAGGELRFTDPRGREVRNVPAVPVGPRLGWPTILAGNADLGITADTPACGSTGDPVDYAACIDALVRAGR